MTCFKLTQLNATRQSASIPGVLSMMIVSSSDDEEEARREEALAAERRRWERVRLMARRFDPVVFVTDCPDDVSLANVDDVRCLLDEETSFDESESRFKAASGMIPSGNDVDSDIGSSLHSGQITDPFP